MTSQKLNEEHEILRRFMAVVVSSAFCWEVLNGVGVDGVGVIFRFFYAFFPFATHFSPFSSLFSASPEGQGQKTANYCKNGEFHSDPSAPTPCKTSRFWASLKVAKFQGFGKGVGGRGFATNKAQIKKNLFPGIVSSFCDRIGQPQNRKTPKSRK